MPHVVFEKSNRRRLPDNSRCSINVKYYNIVIVIFIIAGIAHQFKKTGQLRKCSIGHTDHTPLSCIFLNLARAVISYSHSLVIFKLDCYSIVLTSLKKFNKALHGCKML